MSCFWKKFVIATVTVSTVQAYWVPDEAYLNKREEPTKSGTEVPAKPTTTKKEASKKEESSKAATSKKAEPSSKGVTTSTLHSSAAPPSNIPAITSFVGTFPSATPSAIASPSTTPVPSQSSGSSAGIIGGVIAGVVAVAGVVAFMVVRKKKARQNTRNNTKPVDPFTQGFGSDDTKYYNNNFPPQQDKYQPTNQTSTFDNYEVAPISNNQKPMAAVPAAAAAALPAAAVSAPPQQEQSIGSFRVIATYIPTLSDELEIEAGDHIELIVEYDDGWCQGVNISKGHTKGVFPRHCIDYATAPSNHTNAEIQRSKRVSSMYQQNNF